MGNGRTVKAILEGKTTTLRDTIAALLEAEAILAVFSSSIGRNQEGGNDLARAIRSSRGRRWRTICSSRPVHRWG